ncbi:leucine-rich repeat domain-containing protein [Methylomagnum sp.]
MSNSDDFARALALIEKEKLEKTGDLNLRELYLTELPKQLDELAWLKELGFYGEITDVSILKNLKHLQSLNCGRNQISDLSPLAKLSQLESLDCHLNPLSDLTPIAGMRNLISLDCSSTQLLDISPLAELHKLESLTINRTKLSDLSPLEMFPNYHKYIVHNCYFKAVRVKSSNISLNLSLMALLR